MGLLVAGVVRTDMHSSSFDYRPELGRTLIGERGEDVALRGWPTSRRARPPGAARRPSHGGTR